MGPRAIGLLAVGLRITCLLLGSLRVLVAGECRFPSKWEGLWFQSGMSKSIKIHGGFMTIKGRCVDSDGDKYLLEDKIEHCFRCIVIHERHNNILQYKETFCDSPDTLAKICSGINGDALLHSMFRVDASTVSCPFRGAFTFSYNRGHGDCRNPMSTIETCSEDYRILFRYQACPDTPGTESSVEELTCLATWREGSMRYLVGKLEHNMANTDEDKYRCFVYDKYKDGNGFFVAQSGDATCDGLFSATDGSKLLRLYRVSSPMAYCQFPSWLTHGHQHWHSLDGRRTFSFGHRNYSFRLLDQTGSTADMHIMCKDEVAHSADRRMRIFATHVNIGCTSSYRCFSFTRRGDHVVEVQTGLDTPSREPCDYRHFDRLSAPFTTLVTPLPERRRCPYMGQYTVPGTIVIPRNPEDCDSFMTLKVGCDSSDTIELRFECTTQLHVQAYHCHSNWEENGTSYLITTLKGTKNKYCFMYAETENIVKFSSVRDSCPRNIQLGVDGFLAFNFTPTPGPAEQCSQSEVERTVMGSGSSTLSPQVGGLMTLITVWLFAR